MANFGGLLKSGFKATGKFFVKYGPDILIAVGAGSLVAGTILAIKDTPKAMERRKAAEEAKGEPLTKSEAIKESLPAYIPTIAATVTGLGCVAGGYGLMHRRLSATAFSLAASEKALNEFTEKAREVVGDKKTEEIKDAVAEKHILENPVSKNDVIITGKGDHLIYDSYSGRYFKGDIETVRQAVNTFNEALLTEMTKPLGDLYDILDIPQTEITNQVGWDVSKGLVDVRFSSHLTDTGEPCLSLEYWNEPTSDYCYHSY